MAKQSEINKMDLYGILGVSPDATEKDIVKAYRKKALKCHPDKNPDNPKAAELFHELSRALEVLTDPAAKAAYDNVLRARKAAEERNRALDSKRKKLKDDLEAREQRFDQRKAEDQKAQKNLEAEIQRLRKEGSRLLEQEQEFLRQQMKDDEASTNQDDEDPSEDTETPKIKIRWSSKKPTTYSEEYLQALFSRYGRIANILISSKKKSGAIIEFESPTPRLLLAEQEKGDVENPLTVTWLSGKPSAASPPAPTTVNFANFSEPVPSSGSGIQDRSLTVSHRDFESLVMMKMRQAEERKRLIAQMMKEDEET
ncbi:hypothetical protein BaRGS_00029745 [Batillaria attramentaria]|uniref:DnaJ homolog subfamily C member 17 n=1 Tax=Batillaria attramentaria TaxID=370345 RepID=A0ABD0JV82_9CAEN